MPDFSADADFSYEGISVEDRVGYETLRRMASVSHYNRWIYEELAPYTGDRVLEVTKLRADGDATPYG